MTHEILTKGSLCTGVGGLDAAAPGELAWYSEISEAAALVTGKAYPGVPNLGDITVPDFHPPVVDVLTSGDPCQSMSLAGRQLSSEDDRFLWPDVMRVIDRVRPREVFLENVQGLVSAPLVKGADDWRGERGSVLKMRLDDLRAAGYECRWTVLGACVVGAPHHRHRWFLRGRYVGLGAPLPVRVGKSAMCGAPRAGGRVLLPSPTAADGMGGPGISPLRVGGMNLRMAVALLPTPRATDTGTPGRRSSEGWRPQLGQVIHSLLPKPTWGRYADAVALWEQITGLPAPEPTVEDSKGGRRLNPELSEWMMGYPRGYLTGHLSRNEALRAAGNGVVTLAGQAAWDML